MRHQKDTKVGGSPVGVLRASVSLAVPDDPVDRSPEATAAAQQFFEEQRQWLKICEIFRQHGKWLQ